MKIKDTLDEIRIYQWYKNLIIFLPIVFGKQIFNLIVLEKTLLGFVALCLISSTNYVINDILDFKKNKLHHKKKLRPIASDKIKKHEAIILATILFILAVSISLTLSPVFAGFVFLLFVLTQIYSLFLKYKLFIDILMKF